MYLQTTISLPREGIAQSSQQNATQMWLVTTLYKFQCLKIQFPGSESKNYPNLLPTLKPAKDSILKKSYSLKICLFNGYKYHKVSLRLIRQHLKTQETDLLVPEVLKQDSKWHLDPGAWELLQPPIEPPDPSQWSKCSNHTLQHFWLQEQQATGILATSALCTSLCAKKPNTV